MNNLLYEINGAILSLTESLAEGDIDEQTYQDTIESLGAENAIEDIVKSIKNLEAEADAIKTEMENLYYKKDRAEATVAKLKKVLLDHMNITNTPKLKAGVFSISQGSTQSVDLMYEDIENYPEEYLVAQKPKLDKRKLLKDLKEGYVVDGVVLKTSKYIKIK